jgi:hypothetical protein
MGATTKQVAKADEEFLRAAAERIRMHVARDAVEIGRELIAAKERVGHGKFLHWLEFEVEISEPTATRMMNVAREYGGKSFPVKDLRRKVLYELAAPSTPPEVRDKIERRVLAGEKVTANDVHALKLEVEERAHVVEHGIPALVEAIDRGDVSLSAAWAFVRHPPSRQNTLILKAGGSVATAVKKANAEAQQARIRDRRTSPSVQNGTPRLIPDPAATAGDPIQKTSDDRETAKQNWQRDCGRLAEHAIAMRAYWTEVYGDWEKFEVPTSLATLAEQAAKAWAELAADLAERAS